MYSVERLEKLEIMDNNDKNLIKLLEWEVGRSGETLND